MATRRPKSKPEPAPPPVDLRSSWLVVRYLPTALFSLRMTHATSKGGKTLLLPTPYVVKMALIDACFRMFDSASALQQARNVFDWIKARPVHLRPPRHCVVQNTFIKVLDHERDSPLPFKQTIAYREFVAYQSASPEDPFQIALGAGALEAAQLETVRSLFAHIPSFGKRGSFFQFLSCEHTPSLQPGFTAPLTGPIDLAGTSYALIQYLDDFGDALCNAKDGFDRISTYSSATLKLGEHRVLVPTAIPYRRRSAAKSFTWYERTS